MYFCVEKYVIFGSLFIRVLCCFYRLCGGRIRRKYIWMIDNFYKVNNLFLSGVFVVVN